MPHAPPNTPANTPLEQHWQSFRQCVSRANRQFLGNVTVSEFCSQFSDSVAETVAKCRETRKRCRTQEELVDDSDEALSKLAKYTDALPLENYSGMLSFVPRMVNVVSLAEAIPVAGTATSLPLDLHRIASTCTNAYLAPRRFAAVQMAFAMPRCRVLVFRAPAPPPPPHSRPTPTNGTRGLWRVRRHRSVGRHRVGRPHGGATGHRQGGSAARTGCEHSREHSQLPGDQHRRRGVHSRHPQLRFVRQRAQRNVALRSPVLRRPGVAPRE